MLEAGDYEDFSIDFQKRMHYFAPLNKTDRGNEHVYFSDLEK